MASTTPLGMTTYKPTKLHLMPHFLCKPCRPWDIARHAASWRTKGVYDL